MGVALLVALALALPLQAQTFPIQAGTGIQGFSGDGGLAVEAQLAVPSAVFVDADGNITIADTSNDRVRLVAPDGRIRTLAGTGDRASTGDGGPASDASLHSPTALWVDGGGNVYIAEWTGHRVRRISPKGTITTIVGVGTHGFRGDGGPSSEGSIWSPSAIHLDGDGNLYIAEWGNHRIRKVSPDGTIRTLAGTGLPGYVGDGGPATKARLSNPNGIFVDPEGRVYFSDLGNQRVRRIDTDGRIETVAGDGRPEFRGDGGPATRAALTNPSGLFIDGAGSLFIVDAGNGRIRRVDTAGIITTVAGGAVADREDVDVATDLQLSNPTSLFIDARGDVYVAEGSGHRVRRMPGLAAPTDLPGARPKTSDFDGDNLVGFTDFLLFLDRFGSTETDPSFDARFDLFEDGVVDLSDFLRFARAFGKAG